MTRFLLALLFTAPIFAADLDRDSLDDTVEQSLLEQFVPRFYLAKGECDVAPAEFAPASTEPRAASRNGTIYGQAFPIQRPDGGRWVELHFHHLWSRDCGRGGHPLDAEHVSALVRETAGKWRAEYWYAAAHEGTVCDVSMAHRADVEARAEVWISQGKHASFLSRDACNRGGCGSDRCDDPRKLAVVRVINLGQLGALMPGTEWAASTQWPLAAKLDTDFSEPLLARLHESDGPIRASEAVRGVQTTLAVGYKPVGALDASARKTGAALASTDAALDASARETGGFLKRAARGVGRFFGGR